MGCAPKWRGENRCVGNHEPRGRRAGRLSEDVPAHGRRKHARNRRRTRSCRRRRRAWELDRRPRYRRRRTPRSAGIRRRRQRVVLAWKRRDAFTGPGVPLKICPLMTRPFTWKDAAPVARFTLARPLCVDHANEALLMFDPTGLLRFSAAPAADRRSLREYRGDDEPACWFRVELAASRGATGVRRQRLADFALRSRPNHAP